MLVIKKLIIAILTLFVGHLLLTIYFRGDETGAVWVISFYGAPVLLLYGIPTSLISDGVTKRLASSSFTNSLIALVIHLSLAFAFVIGLWMIGPGELYLLVFIPAMTFSFVFWFIDELKKCEPLIRKISRILNKIGDLKI